MTLPPRRVVVTGIGVVTSLGHGVDVFWSRLIGGASGLRQITRFDTRRFITSFAGEVDGLEGLVQDRFVEGAVLAARQAIAQSQDVPRSANVLIGTAFGGVESLANGQFDRSFAWNAANALAAVLDTDGDVLTYQASFTGSANAIGEGFERIRRGRSNVAVVGGSEAAITPSIVAGFIAMGATSLSTGNPAEAVKPFALDRDGCAIGEGSAVIVLEEWEHAVERGAPMLAEVAGYGTTADAEHVVALPPDGDGIVRAMRLALDQADLQPEAIDYINAHGTGTSMNDAIETVAMKQVFGAAAASIPISSTKPATGHLLGAAGALEAVIVIQSLRTGIVPPTLNLNHADPACDLDYVPLIARHVSPAIVMSNSMGFGGHAVSLIFRRVTGFHLPEPNDADDQVEHRDQRGGQESLTHAMG
ncbi:MAG: beta-ketoacyl-[acyl-carrier-protein] synthase family protein [Thermomicrobiales bacterium]